MGAIIWGKLNVEESKEQNDADKKKTELNKNIIIVLRLYLSVLRRWHRSGSRIQEEIIRLRHQISLESKPGSGLL